MLYMLLAALIVLADQLLKNWAVHNLQGAGSVKLIPGILNLYYAENTGAAFSMFRDMRWTLSIVSVAAVGLILYIILSKKFPGKVATLSLCMILGGAVGNLIDRVFNGFVVDMLEFAFIRFAIFNLADVFVTCGGVLFCAYYIILETKRIRREPMEGSGNEN